MKSYFTSKMSYSFQFRDVFAQKEAIADGIGVTLQLSAVTIGLGFVLGIAVAVSLVDLKFNIRNSPAHMGVKMGEHNLVRWLDSFVFFNTQNTELDKLHLKWLNRKMDPMPTL